MLRNDRGEVLVTRRSDDAHQGGLWEFPGGKIEAGERVSAALERELAEELGIRVRAARPLVRVRHDYGDRRVLLDVWRVDAWEGDPHGREDQALRWLPPGDLRDLPMPAADVPVVTAVDLPDAYLITPAPGADREAFLDALAASVDAGIALVGLRAKSLPEDELTSLARAAAHVCQSRGARLLVNGPPSLLEACGADGIHLASGALMATEVRPIPDGNLLAASCHDAAELERATRIGVDFAVLSPVAATASHPDATPLGWVRFQALVEEVNLPVYGLGGLGPEDLDAAWRHGAQGIAAIRSLWRGKV